MASAEISETPTTSLSQPVTASSALHPRRELLMSDQDAATARGDDEITVRRDEFQRLLKNQEEMLKKQQILEESLAQESRARKKIRPSRKVKSTIHTIYNGLLEDGMNWDTTKPFGHQLNVIINKEIKDAVKNQLKEDDAVIHVAMKTYFMTKRKENKRQTNGKTADFRKKQARRQRKQQKLSRRKEMLAIMTSMGEREKELIKGILTTEYISSEDTDSSGEHQMSDDDFDIASNKRAKALRRRPQSWRAKRVDDVFDILDKKHCKKLKKMGGGFIHTRQDGAPSLRSAPEDAPVWAVKQNALSM
ncbi:uncharacterized protein [Ptychodera flava]|uniref:uncharacterized protein n=1 Tax=Ptychodera flava TaxID=63121 RepID=UPI00396A5BD0